MFRSFTRARQLTVVAVASIAASSMLTAAGCGGSAASGATSPTVIVVRDGANGTTVSVTVGDRLELILSSSYWKMTGSSAPHVLRQDGPAMRLPRPGNCPDIPGLGCIPVRADFTALKGGKAIIRASRSVCGEALRCAGRPTQFAVTVMVTDQRLAVLIRVPGHRLR